MSEIEHARVLLELAGMDRDALLLGRSETQLFADALFGFHAQQAVEKALEA